MPIINEYEKRRFNFKTKKGKGGLVIQYTSIKI